MRYTSILSVSFLAAVAFHPATASVPTRRFILSTPAAQPNLPPAAQASQAAAAASLNLSNIQADVLIGMKKKEEIFFFFRVNNVKQFKSNLRSMSSKLTTTTQILDVENQPNPLINVAFSQSGLTTLGIQDSLNDAFFSGGQFVDANNLGDPGTINWVQQFKGTNMHGVFLLVSDEDSFLALQLAILKTHFGSSISGQYTLSAKVRPGDQEGHEHFGFMDGISQPGINGFTTNPTPGQAMLDPGLFLLGETGDVTPRPSWAKDGSFLAFRQLKQFVPEFEKFLTDNPIIEPGLTIEQGSALMGARMVGRWKSGAPVDLAPLFDDPELANDPQRNNNFTFVHPGEDNKSNQTRCPFSAHVRKTAPRGDFASPNIKNHVMRSGLPYGPEVTDEENQTNTTKIERGLAFVSYQSDIGNGFRFLQHNWASNPSFFFDKVDPTPGFDSIIGANNGQPRFVSGLDPTNSSRDITLVTDFVQSRGGEYFFSPSISAIATIITN